MPGIKPRRPPNRSTGPQHNERRVEGSAAHRTDLEGGGALPGGLRQRAAVVGGQHGIRDLPEVVGDDLGGRGRREGVLKRVRQVLPQLRHRVGQQLLRRDGVDGASRM